MLFGAAPKPFLFAWYKKSLNTKIIISMKINLFL